MRCCVVLSLLLAVAPFARAGEQDEVPTYQNPQMEHVTVESAMPKEYLSICPNVCELADGSLLIAYHRIGYVDWTGGFSSFTRISRDGGKTWSDARLFAKDIQAPGLVRLRSGDLLLSGCQFVSEHSSTMKLFRSRDGGHSWTEQKPIWEKSPGFYLQGGCASLIELKSGRILCPMFGSTGGGTHAEAMQAWCFFSDDDGRTWLEGKGRTIALPEVGSEEPSVGELENGTLVMTLRTSIGAVYVSRSTDQGDKWSEPWSSGLEAPAAPLAMTAFPDGRRLLMVYCSGKFDPRHHHKGERTPLTAAVSKDGGKTWRKIGNIVGGPHEFGATTICFTSAGKVIIGYDWHRLPWERTVKTGGVRLAIADKGWFDRDATKD